MLFRNFYIPFKFIFTCFIYYLSLCSIKNPKNTIKFYIATRSFILDYTKFYNITTKLNLYNTGVSCIFSFIFSFIVFLSHYKNNFLVYFFNSCFIFFFDFHCFVFSKFYRNLFGCQNQYYPLINLHF